MESHTDKIPYNVKTHEKGYQRFAESEILNVKKRIQIKTCKKTESQS